MEKRNGRRVLLKDIANATGFSINTISHALNDKPDISEETKKRIRDVADRMGYIGNASASFLRSGVSKVVAIIVGDITNPFFSILVKEIETSLRGMGYLSFVLNTDENEAIERQAILAALHKNVDGILICPTPNGIENIRFLDGMTIPFVLVGRHFAGMDLNYVVSDDVVGGYEAASYLLGCGHKKILFLNGPLLVSSARERLEGYRRALAERGIPFDGSLVAELPITTEGGDEEIARALQSRRDATAVIAYSDMIAWKVIYALGGMGRRVPEDVSVVGFDDIQSRYRFPVLLTTISISKETIARKAVEMLMNKFSRQGGESEKFILPTHLIVRSTTRSLGPQERPSSSPPT